MSEATGPFTIQEAKVFNSLDIPTGGCWRCIQNEGPKGKTQWKVAELKFIGHRQFCSKHYYEELNR